MLIISVLIYLFLAFLLAWRFYKEVRFTRVVTLFFLVTVAFNILVAEILSLAGKLNEPGWFLLLQFACYLPGALVLWDPRQRIFAQPLPPVKFAGRLPHGWEGLLLILTGCLIALAFYSGSLAPINNSDSLHTHLPRIYYWIQHGSLASWDAITETQLSYPINLSLQGLWLFLLGGSEMLFYLMPALALIIVGLMIYEIAILLGAAPFAALFAALVSLSYPVVLLQTFSYQGDDFVAALALVSVFFLLRYFKGDQKFDLAFSMLALALALGTKQTAFLYLPFYLLALLLHLLRHKAQARVYLFAGGIFLVFFASLSSYKFIQNAREQDRLQSSMFASYRYSMPFSQSGDGLRYATNSLRYLYQGASVEGLTGKLKIGALETRDRAFRWLSRQLGVDLEVKAYISQGDEEYFKYGSTMAMNEDAAWFGPLSVMLLPLSALAVLLGRNKAQKYYLLGAFVFLIVVFILIAVLITGWSPTNGRYLILPVLLFSPLLSALVPGHGFTGKFIPILLGILAAGIGFSSLLINDCRPLITQYSLYAYQQERNQKLEDTGFFTHAYIYISDRVIEDLALTSSNRRDIRHLTYYEQLFFQSSGDLSDIEFVNAHVPATETLYVWMPKSILEYALFGRDKTRDLNPVRGVDQVPSGAFFLVDDEWLKTPPTGMTLIAENVHFLILRKD
ncbi:MAG: glycosyltransferase family 39 protein [Anaerolineaceae bacterium]|nr:glycosyltransferase family 39 protein [Anaerolineaceae bacterium]